ncbi:MAG TPA: F0F1 ATP synthase subunit B [bacterium]|nr:F0F1 ATP synthase subunit B [bacterium]
MVSIEPVLLLVQLLTFGAAVFLLWKFFWKPLKGFMKNRADRIENDIRSAGELKSEAENLKQKWDEQMGEAEVKAQAIIQQGVEQGGFRRDEIVRDAEAEAKRLLDDANVRIAEEKRKTARELRTETVALAMLIAERALKQSVDPGVQERLVKEFAEKLSASPNAKAQPPNA